MRYGSREIECIILYFDQSMVLYISILNSLIIATISIIYRWYTRTGVCRYYIYNIKLEILWTILPIIFVVVIALHSISVIYNINVNKGINNKYVSVIGNQWYWIYNNIESRITNLGRLILVDQPLFLKSNVTYNLLVNSLDVIHSFALPTLGIKIDAIPGRVNSVSLSGLCSGLYVGYCSELCGSGHAFMPINVVVY